MGSLKILSRKSAIVNGLFMLWYSLMSNKNALFLTFPSISCFTFFHAPVLIYVCFIHIHVT